MKHVNGDLDDLFRRASDRYPLRADGADWDRLANALDNDPEPSSGNVEDKRRRRGIFWWFLLVPLGGLGWLAWHANARHGGQKDNVTVAQTAGTARQGVVTAVRPEVAGQPAVGGAGPGKANPVAVQSAGSVGAGPAGAGSVEVVAAAEKSGDVDRFAAAEKSGDAAKSGVVAGSVRTGKLVKVSGVVAGSDNVTGSDVGSGSGVGSGSDVVSGSDGKRKVANGVRGGQTAADEADGVGSKPAGSAGAAGNVNADRELVAAALDLRRARTAEEWDLVVHVAGPGHATDNLPQAPKKTTSNSKTSYGYIGVLGAPDFSTVKFQSMKGIGTTFGLLLGYSFNDRWAVESGVYLDRKRYYTEGEYFSTEKVHLPNNYKNLLNVDGTCYMWEIPLNIRYNFNKSERMKWFATAGLSTYLMTKENYTYQYNYWSGGPTEDSSWKINQPSHYWFSVVNLSAGFEQRLGKIGNLRLEPYVRIPLSGIGTGRLPIMSAGLNIGFTRRLW